MIRFRRRSLNCWEVCDDIENRLVDIPILEFVNEVDLFNYIYKTLPFTKDNKYQLRIRGNVVIQWSVLGWIVE